jgi:hypothetical protein
MAEINQHREPEAFPANTAGNGSQLPSREERQGDRGRADRATIRKATGPRTAQGKERSKLNALKHGLLSKVVLLERESRAAYLSLLNGLRDDFQPQGKLEAVLVENIAALLWRKRRLFQAERAEISERIAFEAVDSIGKLQAEAWELSRAAIASGGSGIATIRSSLGRSKKRTCSFV